jgi:hypothetical protein
METAAAKADFLGTGSAVTDLLTELLHWAAASAAITDIKTPESIVESARFHYEYETEPEEGDDETESEGKG